MRSLIQNSSQDDTSNEESSTNQTYGRLTSFFSAVQTVGSPLVGILLDRIGVRSTSILVYFGSAASYAILSTATTPSGLYWSKVPTLLQHAFLVGQATVSSVEDDSTLRAAALGRMTTAYTIGASIGPALGGFLGEDDLYAGARLAVWGSLLSVVLSVVYLKDQITAKQQHSSTSGYNSFLLSTKRTISYLIHPIIGPLLFIKLLNGISSSAFSTVLPLMLANKLNFTTKNLGYYMSANSLSVAIFACVGIGPAMKCLGDGGDGLAFWGIGFRSGAYIAFGLVVTHILSTVGDAKPEEVPVSKHAMILTTCASIVVSLASHAHATSLTTLTTGSVNSDERGAMLGLEHGLFSMARIVGPPLGTTLLSRGPALFDLGGIGAAGLWRVIAVCVILDLALLVLLKVWSIRQYGRAVKAETTQSESLIKDIDHDHSD